MRHLGLNFSNVKLVDPVGVPLHLLWRRHLTHETRKFAERLAQNPPAAIAGTKSLVYQAAVTPTKQQLDAEETKIIDAMQTDDFRAAVKKFTNKSKT